MVREYPRARGRQQGRPEGRAQQRSCSSGKCSLSSSLSGLDSSDERERRDRKWFVNALVREGGNKVGRKAEPSKGRAHRGSARFRRRCQVSMGCPPRLNSRAVGRYSCCTIETASTRRTKR